MAKVTKKLSATPEVTTISGTQKIPLVDNNGATTRISAANFKNSILGGLDVNAVVDNIFIMYHRKSDNYPLMSKLHEWTSLQAGGEIADGVVIVEGGRVLVVAPTESDATLFWSSAAINGGGTTSTDVITVMNDWSGKTNTAAQIAASRADAVTNTASYAPGFCNLYSRTNANGNGLTAGKWWLPSMGELMCVFANMAKINYALSLITGAIPVKEAVYWSSTEHSEAYAWYVNSTNGLMSALTKALSSQCVRAVSAFIA